MIWEQNGLIETPTLRGTIERPPDARSMQYQATLPNEYLSQTLNSYKFPCLDKKIFSILVLI